MSTLVEVKCGLKMDKTVEKDFHKLPKKKRKHLIKEMVKFRKQSLFQFVGGKCLRRINLKKERGLGFHMFEDIKVAILYRLSGLNIIIVRIISLTDCAIEYLHAKIKIQHKLFTNTVTANVAVFHQKTTTI